MLVRKTRTHRNENKNVNTTNLVSSIIFYHRKKILFLFSVANKNLLKASVNNTNPLGKIISHIR